MCNCVSISESENNHMIAFSRGTVIDLAVQGLHTALTLNKKLVIQSNTEGEKNTHKTAYKVGERILSVRNRMYTNKKVLMESSLWH